MAHLRRGLLTNPSIAPRLIAAVTKVFRALLHEEMRSGVMLVYYLDILVYFCFMLFFTYLTFELKFAHVPLADKLAEHTDIFVACACFLAYFTLRELTQLSAMISLELPDVWLRDGWNYVELLGSFGSISFLIYIELGYEKDHLLFASIVSLFNWLKVLCLMKSFSQPIATFVLMVFEIITNLGSFMIVMAVCIAMFGNALYLVLEGTELNLHDGDEPFETWTATSKTLYSMILGEFDKTAYSDTWSFILFLMYSMLVVIILLNVLIAIVGDSYDSVLVKSEEMYWRARLYLIAKVKTTGRFLANRTFRKHKEEAELKVVQEVSVRGAKRPILPIPPPFSNNTNTSRSSQLDLDLTIEDPSASWGGKILDTVNRVTKSDANASLRRDIMKQRIQLAETQTMVELLLEKVR